MFWKLEAITVQGVELRYFRYSIVKPLTP